MSLFDQRPTSVVESRFAMPVWEIGSHPFHMVVQRSTVSDVSVTDPVAESPLTATEDAHGEPPAAALSA